MQFTFLGTGTSQGVPVIGCTCAVCSTRDSRDQRLRSSLLVNNQGRRILVDPGPDLRQQLLREGVDNIEAILITHPHQDHVAGLDDIRPINFRQDLPMPVYGNPDTLRRLRQQYAYIFENAHYPGVPKLELRLLPSEPFSLAGIEIQALELRHGQIPVHGFRFENFTYITDANYLPPAAKEVIRGSEILVLNALRHEPHHSHFTLAEALAERMACKYLGRILPTSAIIYVSTLL
jgi:Metal-dependent hydrolases of the beta-lactamase superfamily I